MGIVKRTKQRLGVHGGGGGGTGQEVGEEGGMRKAVVRVKRAWD